LFNKNLCNFLVELNFEFNITQFTWEGAEGIRHPFSVIIDCLNLHEGQNFDSSQQIFLIFNLTLFSPLETTHINMYILGGVKVGKNALGFSGGLVGFSRFGGNAFYMGVSGFFIKTLILAFFRWEKPFSVKTRRRKKFWKKFFKFFLNKKNIFLNYSIFIPGRIVSALRASTNAPTLSLRLRLSLTKLNTNTNIYCQNKSIEVQ